MSSMKIKSSIRDYKVIFVENSNNLLSDYSDKDVVIVDKNVFSKWDNLFSDVPCKIIKIEATEKQKSYQEIGKIINGLIEFGFRKNGKIIAVGGGITQDICGFISSIMFRGVEWEFYPTTLLAQGDSCIGGKTSVNFGKYKNQLGNFNPPNRIIIHSGFIDSLPRQDIRSGVGEMLHFYLVSGEDDFKYYKEEFRAKWGNPYSIERLVKRCLEIKKRFIEIDEFDQKERQVFNYGHSFGHAIESLSDYTIPHGIAVSFGMDMANYISVKRRHLSETVRFEIRELLEKIWTGYDIKNMDIQNFAKALSKDKKNVGQELRLILCKGYGKVFKTAQNLDDEFKGWLRDYFSHELN